MKIIGLDPGLGNTGWGVIKYKNADCEQVNHGCVTTYQTDSIERRIKVIYDETCAILRKLAPDEAAIEELFFNTNSKTAMQVGQARGVVILALNTFKIPVFHYTPLQIKIAITGYGRAEKSQIKSMVKTLLRIEENLTPDDVSDALAAAITHAYYHRIIE